MNWYLIVFILLVLISLSTIIDYFVFKQVSILKYFIKNIWEGGIALSGFILGYYFGYKTKVKGNE